MTWLDRQARQSEKLRYYVRNALRLLLPRTLARAQLPRLLAQLERHDPAELFARVDAYAALPEHSALGPDAVRIGDFHDTRRWTYFFDLRRTLVHFDPDLRFRYVFGDVKVVPERASFVKSRPLHTDNRNSVLLKLNRVRHFYFAEDRLPFQDKRPRVVWRGRARHENRQRVLRRFHDHPLCDVGHVGPAEVDPAWHKPRLTIREQLANRYVLNIEGNDVATSLKWSMASQSLCLMVRPRFETWFLEGRLLPGVHYVELAEDYSDLEAQVAHYESHPAEALAIVRNANRYVVQFRDAQRERLLELLVAARYFERTDQGALLGGLRAG